MLLAIPFQGIASAAMLACAHDAPQGATPAVHASAQHEAAGSPCHDMQAPTPGPSQDTHGHDSRCSACAACNLGAAIAPVAELAPQPPALTFALPVFASGRLAAVDLAQPERPPRFLLA